MERIKLRTIHEVIAASGAKHVLAISSNYDIEYIREDGEKIDRPKFRNVESAFLAALLENGIYNTPMPWGEASTRISELRKKGTFDLAIVMGDLPYRNMSIAAKLQELKFKAPIYLEITKESANKARDISTTVVTAQRASNADLLRHLVYLTKVRPSPPFLDLDIDPLPVVEKPPLRAPGKRRAAEPREFVPQVFDLVEPPSLVRVQVTRVIRDTVTARAIKKLYAYRCQVCGISLGSAERRYIEVHHVRPLGGVHRGRDTNDNMLVLCPNHHAIFDLGWAEFVSPHAVRIGSETFPLISKHALSAQCITYHNENLRRV